MAGGPGVSGAGTFDFTRRRPAAQRIGRRTPDGGAEETRTPDFLLAKEALYQLSYGPDAKARGRTVGLGPRAGCAGSGPLHPASEASRWCRHGPTRRSRVQPSDIQRNAASGRFWTRTRDLCLIRAVL
jgi:hypothetical protein